MRMKTPEDAFFSASVIDIPADLQLKDSGPKIYASALKNFGSDIKIISNRPIKLRCGTEAYRTEIKWLWKSQVKLTSIIVSAFKENKCIYLVTHTTRNPEKMVKITQSLSFR